MRIVYKALAALALSALATTASAQQYPEKPIRLVIPFPPGGGTDVVARVIAQKLGESTGWTLVADNKPGSGGSVGLSLAGKAAPDGYTIVLAQNANLVINPILGKCRARRRAHPARRRRVRRPAAARAARTPARRRSAAGRAR